ncbi:MAG TPA: DUF305 domain-containing protein [Nocardioidaceae bacterium]|nr:DUF305 domain-containing protein [Nocardioidaceae bacterium]
MRLSRTLAAVAAALTLTLAGCASSESSADPSGFNDADVDFATDMIQHHAQALVMVDMTMGRDLDPEMVELTEEIRAAQAPEIEQMADWLEDWDQPVPQTSRDHANAHADDHGGDDGAQMDADMPGMMSAEEMDALEDASGEEFRTMWLEMMIEHHQGAVEMAETVVEEGQNGEVRALAEDVIRTQSDEISTMQDLLEG